MDKASLLLKGGLVVTPSETKEADILVVDGKIVEIGCNLAAGNLPVIDIAGTVALPGGVDVHTHLGMIYAGARTVDSFASGTSAAAAGGSTTVIDFAIQERGQSLMAALQSRRADCEGQSQIDFGLHLLVQEVGADFAEELLKVREAGVSSIQLTLSDPGGWMLDDGSLLRAMLAAAKADMTVLVDAENGLAAQVLAQDLLAAGKTGPQYHALAHPPLLEAEAIQRAIDLAEVAGCKLHVALVSCERSLARVEAARGAGLPITADTCIQYLELDRALTEGEQGEKFICSPPLRQAGDREALWAALAAGGLRAVISDHCSYNWAGQKNSAQTFTEIPGGLPTIEDRYSLLMQRVFEGRMDWPAFAELVATGPAKLFGLCPAKGALIAGADADIVVVDPAGRRTITAARHHMAVDYSCFEGRALVGSFRHVMQRGEFLVRDGVRKLDAAKGGFLRRRTTSV